MITIFYHSIYCSYRAVARRRPLLLLFRAPKSLLRRLYLAAPFASARRALFTISLSDAVTKFDAAAWSAQ